MLFVSLSCILWLNGLWLFVRPSMFVYDSLNSFFSLIEYDGLNFCMWMVMDLCELLWIYVNYGSLICVSFYFRVFNYIVDCWLGCWIAWFGMCRKWLETRKNQQKIFLGRTNLRWKFCRKYWDHAYLRRFLIKFYRRNRVF